MPWLVRRGLLSGQVSVPGDKSIGHRAVMLAALADGESRIRDLPTGQDVRSTLRCIEALGAKSTPLPGHDAATGDDSDHDSTELRVMSSGHLVAPTGTLDAGNSGTTMRLLAGILAGQPFASCLDGDASLRGRPMGRVIEPLTMMGASIASRDGWAPLQIEGRRLHGISYRLPVASAQVKSAILLAGLRAEGPTTVCEPVPTRDHTERLLSALGIELTREGASVTMQPGQPQPVDTVIPGDLSSAAFWLAAGALGSDVTVRCAGTNPTRTGFLNVLERMGAAVGVSNEREQLGEPRGDVRVSGRVTDPVEVTAEEVPGLIDELPLIALLATQVRGTSVVRGAAELRVKESDRIASVVTALDAMGANIEERRDGFVVRGPTRFRGATVSSAGDHRLAMLLAIAGSIAEGETFVEGSDVAAVSYPEFAATFRRMGGTLESV